MGTNTDPMAEIKVVFFIECEELLEALQDGLQAIENGEDDPETINVIFRAVHSIKGGAGAFGLEGLVRFAHCFETVLDAARASTLVVEAGVLNVCFQATDHLSDLVRISRDDGAMPEPETARLLAALESVLEGPAGEMPKADAEIDFQPMGVSLDLDLDDADQGDDASRHELDAECLIDYIIEFKPLAALFATGNEPALLLRNLAQLGDMSVECETSHLPELGQFSPDTPYISWIATLQSVSNESEVRAIFEFVEGLCRVDIRIDAGVASVTLATNDQPTVPVRSPDLSPAPSNPLARPSTVEKPKKTTNNGAATVNSIVRVDLERIERLVNLVGELVINQAMLSQSLEKSGLPPHCDAMSGLEEFQRLTRDIQDSVMMIRAQPVKSLFQRMSRIVREASAAVGKDIRLYTTGESTEVDKTVIERLADPLTHMIRNAVDHGLETSETRFAKGKSPQGRVNLSAAHRSGRVVIEVSDDGAGIDRPRVRQIAIDKGLIPENIALSDSEVDNLLFLPGFSTASEVSDLSGRGVGMDVVRTAIQSLGGRITITSAPDQGTTFAISLPLTLAVLDGMVIKVAGETLVLPLNLMVETLTLEHSKVLTVCPGQMAIEVRRGFVPLFDLGAALGYRAALQDFDGAVVLLIAQDDESYAGLIIDSIVDQRQVVIKGLDDGFYRAPGIAAATILGDGQIALILDPCDIICSTAIPQNGGPLTANLGVSA